MGNRNLHLARKDELDEFYTQLSDIEKELKHYKEHFEGKTVFCNCDDPYESNFFKYFALNFNYLGLKKLIATCYDGSPILSSEFPLAEVVGLMENGKVNYTAKAYKIIIEEVKDYNQDGAIDLLDITEILKNKKNVLTLLNGNGDFRSKEAIELLKNSDIVVTNPPFSLFREYLAQLMEYNKDFLIVGNQNAVTYKEVFPLIKEGEVWLGYNHGAQEFMVPDYYDKNNIYIRENGKKYAKFGNICWFTNLDFEKRHEDLILHKKYSEEEYPKYDNCDIINVNKVSEIPEDYFGIMGVPITFLQKFNPSQFKICGLANSARYLGDINCLTIIKNKKIYNRVLIKRKKDNKDED